MEKKVELFDVSFAIGGRPLWEGVDMELPAGVVSAITGPSGSGKTSLLHCLGLLERFSSGTYVLEGEDVSAVSARRARQLRREKIGYLFQDFAIIENDTVAQNVEIAAERGVRRKARQQLVADALQAVGLGGRGADKTFVLSGGEQQRVALARLLVRKPPLVLADEPTAALDRHNASMVLSLLRTLALDNDSAVLVVSHDPWVLEQCDEVLTHVISC